MRVRAAKEVGARSCSPIRSSGDSAIANSRALMASIPGRIPASSRGSETGQQCQISVLVVVHCVMLRHMIAAVGTELRPQLWRADQPLQVSLPVLEAASVKPLKPSMTASVFAPTGEATQGSEAAMYCSSLNAHLPRAHSSSDSGITPM